jgi:hypothetical protein
MPAFSRELRGLCAADCRTVLIESEWIQAPIVSIA